MIKLKHKTKKGLGFTLIELLVVVSIIGLVASALLTTVAKARSKGRDVKRVSDTRNVLNALAIELNTRGKFPCHRAFDDSTQGSFMEFLITDGLIGEPNIKDPINSGSYTYSYMTFKSKVGGPCGQVVYFDYTTEGPITSCVGSGILFNNNHCHVFFPNPPNCPNWTDLDLTGCTLKDTTNDY